MTREVGARRTLDFGSRKALVLTGAQNTAWLNLLFVEEHVRVIAPPSGNTCSILTNDDA